MQIYIVVGHYIQLKNLWIAANPLVRSRGYKRKNSFAGTSNMAVSVEQWPLRAMRSEDLHRARNYCGGTLMSSRWLLGGKSCEAKIFCASGSKAL